MGRGSFRGVYALVIAAVVLVVGGVIGYIYARPTFVAQQSKSLGLTRSCVEHTPGLAEDTKLTKLANDNLGVPAIGVDWRTDKVTVFFAASAKDAQKVENARRKERIANDDGASSDAVPQALADATIDALVNRSGSLVVDYQDIPSAEAASAFAQCIYSYKTARFTSLLGIEESTIGRPFLTLAAERQKISASPLAFDRRTLNGFSKRWGELGSRVTDIINHAASTKDVDRSTAQLRAQAPGVLAQMITEGPKVQDSFRNYQPKTRVGARLKAIGLHSLLAQEAAARTLYGAFASQGRIWNHAVTFATVMNDQQNDLSSKFLALFNTLSPQERQQWTGDIRGRSG